MWPSYLFLRVKGEALLQPLVLGRHAGRAPADVLQLLENKASFKALLRLLRHLQVGEIMGVLPDSNSSIAQ